MNTPPIDSFIIPDVGDKTIYVPTNTSDAIALLGDICGVIGINTTGLPVPRVECDVIIHHLADDTGRLQHQVLQALQHMTHTSTTFRVTSRQSESVDGDGPDGALMHLDKCLLSSREEQVFAATTIGWRLDTFHTPKVGEPAFGRWLLIDRRGDDWLAWILDPAKQRSSGYASGVLEQWAFELWRRTLVTQLTAIGS